MPLGEIPVPKSKADLVRNIRAIYPHMPAYPEVPIPAMPEIIAAVGRVVGAPGTRRKAIGGFYHTTESESYARGRNTIYNRPNFRTSAELLLYNTLDPHARNVDVVSPVFHAKLRGFTSELGLTLISGTRFSIAGEPHPLDLINVWGDRMDRNNGSGVLCLASTNAYIDSVPLSVIELIREMKDK